MRVPVQRDVSRGQGERGILQRVRRTEGIQRRLIRFQQREVGIQLPADLGGQEFPSVRVFRSS